MPGTGGRRRSIAAELVYYPGFIIQALISRLKVENFVCYFYQQFFSHRPPARGTNICGESIGAPGGGFEILNAPGSASCSTRDLITRPLPVQPHFWPTVRFIRFRPSRLLLDFDGFFDGNGSGDAVASVIFGY